MNSAREGLRKNGIHENLDLNCEPCQYRKEEVSATKYCKECNERYCDSCTFSHTKHKQTKNHTITDIREAVVINLKKCEPCDCKQRTQMLPSFAKTIERKTESEQTEPRDHQILDGCSEFSNASDTVTDASSNATFTDCLPCEPCLNQDMKRPATSYCINCDEKYCENCTKRHKAQRRTNDHDVVDLSILNSTKMCDICIYSDEKILHGSCVWNVVSNFAKVDFQENRSEEMSLEKDDGEQCPGKPYVTETTTMSTNLIVKWDDAKLCENEAYQVMFKETTTGKWKSTRSNTVKAFMKMEGLQPQTPYVFRVRVVNDISGDEGPFGPESDTITTGESAALGMMKVSTMVYNNPIPVYALPLMEFRAARNEHAKSRKLCLGSITADAAEKNIMIVGATGSGKSTLINAMANYIMGVSWEDPFRFTLVNVEASEKERTGNQAISQTEWITCYNINTSVSSRLKYNINLIDTPGFGDTRGLDHDQSIVNQIKELFTVEGSQGVPTIDAVCFILKAPDARLTQPKYNICTLITFADGQRPPVLAALEALEFKSLSYEKYFTFNNSALFVDNSSNDPNDLGPTFWEMGMKSCEAFFDYLVTLQTKSLLLTSEVLDQRERLANTVHHLHQEIDIGLSKIGVLEQEIGIFTKYRRRIRENKNFRYTVTENVQELVDLKGKRQYTTNCLSCNFTCHANCAFANDEEKVNCCAMQNGTCTECPSNCHWTQHHNTPYIIKWVPKKWLKHTSKSRRSTKKPHKNR
ncbi:unnamed protein product [Mytilus edulis]|uniref:Fibronectin type-III domain-containing protein n=1 Tax=Mytilus edulis TaxID=6550 RepID=A0A8S3TDV5_MYTED|nr:unnamed protein product [Mytilus edulis]